jgi:GTPase SAR1 family protein
MSETESQSSSPLNNLDRLGGDVKRLFHAVNNLTHHGIDAIADISIPKIALVGDQSSGKSSLVEALSDIQVPRDAGTCTRCPMEITLSEANTDWTAKVSLLRTHVYDPASNIDGNIFHPWIQLTNAVSPLHFCTVKCKDDLEQALRSAQKAILTPNQDLIPPTDILAPFSPNIIVVQIRGNGLPNLSFVDLPGVISQSDDGPRVVELVKRLARTYIQQPNTLILLACSMENDIMNSQASALVNEEDANDRCIGVLTKPDRLASDIDSAEQWKEVLAGKRFKRGLGYFVTKQPAQSELKGGINHADARIQEMQFFHSTRWQHQFPGHEEKLGTNKLAIALSSQLINLITAQLPAIQAKVQDRLADINEQLSKMPLPPQNPFHEVSKIVRQYGDMIKTLVSSDQHDNNTLHQQCSDELGKFQHHMFENLRPKFLPSTDLDLDLKRKSNNELPIRQSPARRHLDVPSTPRKSQVQEDSSSDEVVYVTSAPKTPTTPRTINRSSPQKRGSRGKYT